MTELTCECSYEVDDADWYFLVLRDYIELDTKRSRRCTSCRGKVAPGDICLPIACWRPTKEGYEENRFGEEYPLANRYVCEKCADIYLSLEELGFCVTPFESMAYYLGEYKKYVSEKSKSE